MSVARVAPVDLVEPHPHPDGQKMSVLTFGDLKGVSQNVGEAFDQPRYKVGDLVVIMVRNAVLPEDVIKMGFWDSTKNDGKGGGMLPKSNGTRVWPKKFHGFESQFITFPVHAAEDGTFFVERGDTKMPVGEGTDVMAFYGVTEFVAP